MESLHPRIMVIWIFQGLIVSLVIAGMAFAANRFVFEFADWWIAVVIFLLLFVLFVIHSILRYRIWRYEIRDDELYLERGVITRVKTVVPFVRIQHVDSRRGPIERGLHLATTVVYTAGSRGADVLVPGLPPERSEALQQDIKHLAIESEGEDAV